jgi:hypothetical protein
MTLQEKIEEAFAHRKMPEYTVDPDYVKQHPGDSDVEDALSFQEKDWREITCSHWNKHWCAFNFLSREALAYYLPSLLLLPLLQPLDHMDMAIDSLVYELDRTPPTSPEDFPTECRLAGLTHSEYEALKEWLLFMSENYPNLAIGAAKGGPGDLFGRAFDTIAVLQKGL